MKLKSLGILGLLLALCAFLSVKTADPWYDVLGSTFLRPNNIENLVQRTAMYGLLGIGVAFVIITSGIDLSIGSIAGLAGCLLAIFLHVDYRAFDKHDVFQVQAQQKTIILYGDASDYSVGDRIRFSGGRRARNALVTIVGVESVRLESSDGRSLGPATQISVDQALSRDDDSGQVARVWAIPEFDASRGAQARQITLAGQHPELAARDQVVLAHPSAGLKQSEVTGVEIVGQNTVVQLARDLGADFTTEWVAIPLERRQRMPIGVALLSVLGIAAGLGLIHGLYVTYMRLQPFIVTLCGLLIYRGISRWLADDQPVGFGNEYVNSLSPLGNGKLVLAQWEQAGQVQTFGIPYPFFILLTTAILAAVFLNQTIWGRYLLALGNNEEAARYSGINTRRLTIVAYVICTVMAAIGGILFALDSNSVSPSGHGEKFELYAIAAAVLGGCSLRGGEGTIMGVIVGTAVMQILNNLILLTKISGTLEYAIIGAVILIGVTADELVKRLAARRRAAADARKAVGA